MECLHYTNRHIVSRTNIQQTKSSDLYQIRKVNYRTFIPVACSTIRLVSSNQNLLRTIVYVSVLFLCPLRITFEEEDYDLLSTGERTNTRAVQLITANRCCALV